MSLRGSFGLLSQDGLPEAAIVVSSVAKHIALLGCRYGCAHTDGCECLAGHSYCRFTQRKLFFEVRYIDYRGIA